MYLLFCLKAFHDESRRSVTIRKLFTMFAYPFVSIIMYKDFKIVLGVLWIETVHSF